MTNGDSSWLIHEWDLVRLQRFPIGRKRVWQRGGITAIDFDQVEFFRRSWGWTTQNVALWEEVRRFHGEGGGAFRVDVPNMEVFQQLRARTSRLEFCYRNEVVSRVT